MKYLKWILKKGPKKTVIVWLTSVIAGLASAAGLFVSWAFMTAQYLISGILPTQKDAFVGALVVVWIFVPSFLAYYFTDRTLYFDGYVRDPDNYQSSKKPNFA